MFLSSFMLKDKQNWPKYMTKIYIYIPKLYKTQTLKSCDNGDFQMHMAYELF